MIKQNQIQENYRLANLAIVNGIKIRPIEWAPYTYIRFNELCDGWDYCNTKANITEAHKPSFNSGTWVEYIDPAELVKWYRPRVVWFKNDNKPEIVVDPQHSYFSRSKDSFKTDVYKVIEWDTIEAPKTWNGIE